MSENPNPIDIAVGTRVRLRRESLGLSQTDIARVIGLTFQQVQKYEKGVNRISASRLMEIAATLETTGAALLGEALPDQPPPSLLIAPGALELLKAYQAIDASGHRHALLAMARTLAWTKG